jgi:hypothetical protein
MYHHSRHEGDSTGLGEGKETAAWFLQNRAFVDDTTGGTQIMKPSIKEMRISSRKVDSA